MTLWNECFGDLPMDTQRELAKKINVINEIVGLQREIVLSEVKK